MCRCVILYPRFTGGQHVVPHDRGPGTGDLIGTGDDNHRQGARLDQQRMRRPFNELPGYHFFVQPIIYEVQQQRARRNLSIMFTHLNLKLQSSMLKPCYKLNDVEFFSDNQTTLLKKQLFYGGKLLV